MKAKLGCHASPLASLEIPPRLRAQGPGVGWGTGRNGGGDAGKAKASAAASASSRGSPDIALPGPPALW